VRAAHVGCDPALHPCIDPTIHAQALRPTPAGIVRTLVEGVARFCPRAWLAIISNPVNSTVPIAAEVWPTTVLLSYF